MPTRPSRPPSDRTARRRTRPPAPPARGRRAGSDPGTRAAIFKAAADQFSTRGFEAAGVDEIARAARVNKAMIYYHFGDKLGLYREVVRDMLRDAGAHVAALAESDAPPDVKVRRFVATFVALTGARPWAPPLMLREIADGAPHLDLETLGLMRDVFAAFARILAEGEAAGAFRRVHPILAYMSIIAPVLLNAARERAAAAPWRSNLPLFLTVSHEELSEHMQRAAVRLLEKE